MFQSPSIPVKILTESSKRKLEKRRTVGIKDGEKTFQMDLNTLAPQILQKYKARKLKVVPLEKGSISTQKTDKELQKEILKNLAPQESIIHVLKNSNFDINFDPPEGVKEDELNSAEKIYYSFQKRAFINFVTSFLNSYNTLATEKPTIRQSLRRNKHLLSGRIIFDAKGNKVSIKIFRSSSDDTVHLLFERTLIGIKKLPNPPQDLITDDNQFSIYYQIKIENQ